MASSIFVTVGTQLPFDRLVSAVDAWAALNPQVEVFAQIGDGAVPRNCRSAAHVDGAEFEARIAAADLVVAHAGMGTILLALDLGRPVIIVPRSAELGEHRNEHQRATAARLAHFDSLTVVGEDESIAAVLDRRCAGLGARVDRRAAPVPVARAKLIEGVRAFAGLEARPC